MLAFRFEGLIDRRDGLAEPDSTYIRSVVLP